MRSSSQVSWGYSDAGATKMCTSTAVWEATIRSLKDKSEVGGKLHYMYLYTTQLLRQERMRSASVLIVK